MDLRRVLEKYIRFPWEVWKSSEHFKDREIATSVAFDCGGLEFFKKCPAEEDLPRVLQSIAIMTTMSLIRGKGDSLVSRNQWPSLSEEERRFVLETLGLTPALHNSMLFLTMDTNWLWQTASYIAAAFAFTTHTKPHVVSFDKLVQASFNSLGGDSYEMAEIRRAGLLIIVGAGGPIAGADKVFGFVAAMLARRQARGNLHMFIDTPDGAVLRSMLGGKRVTRENVAGMYELIFPASLRIHSLLFGPSVYMYPIDSYERAANERRETVII